PSPWAYSERSPRLCRRPGRQRALPASPGGCRGDSRHRRPSRRRLPCRSVGYSACNCSWRVDRLSLRSLLFAPLALLWRRQHLDGVRGDFDPFGRKLGPRRQEHPCRPDDTPIRVEVLNDARVLAVLLVVASEPPEWQELAGFSELAAHRDGLLARVLAVDALHTEGATHRASRAQERARAEVDPPDASARPAPAHRALLCGPRSSAWYSHRTRCAPQAQSFGQVAIHSACFSKGRGSPGRPRKTSRPRARSSSFRRNQSPTIRPKN